MPLPVAHSIAGYGLFELHRQPFFQHKVATLAFFILVANLPDADVLPGLFAGNPNAYHASYSHSLGAALLVGAVLGWFFRYKKGGRFRRYAFLIAGVYYSHILLDFFNQDGRPPHGVMLFWPLNDIYYMAPWPVFAPPNKSSETSTFLSSVLSRRNLVLGFRELWLMSPVFGIALGIRLLRVRRRSVQRRAQQEQAWQSHRTKLERKRSDR